MDTTQKRPRIPTDLAERIDRARGAIAFEAWVRDRLTMAVLDEELRRNDISREEYEEQMSVTARQALVTYRPQWSLSTEPGRLSY
jgi:hypothetical protein